MTFFNWSKTAADNNNADTTVNWSEEQAPSTVNGSARAMMAAAAKFRDDISGNLETAGTSTAYTVTTNQVYTALTDGIFFAARMDEANGAAATIAVDGLTAKAIQTVSGTAMPAGALKAGAVYAFVYDSTADAWIVQGGIGNVMDTSDYPDLTALEAVSGNGIAYRTADDTWSLDDGTTAINFVAGDGVNEITPGIVGDLVIPFDGTITEAWVLADQTGSVVVDLWKDTYSAFPPTNDDSITASAPPTVTTATKSKDTTLTGWTTSVAADDVIRVNVDSVTTITRITLVLILTRYT